MPKGTRKVCSKGHTFYKSSNCPTCPVCEAGGKPEKGFLSLLAAPARRALENAGIRSLKQLSGWSEKEVLKLHGMGQTSMPILRKVLAEAGLAFIAADLTDHENSSS